MRLIYGTYVMDIRVSVGCNFWLKKMWLLTCQKSMNSTCMKNVSIGGKLGFVFSGLSWRSTICLELIYVDL